MAKRRKIGIIYEYNENWIGGTYYIENLISALNTLPEELQPEILVFTENIDQFNNFQKKIKYSLLKRRDYKRKLNLPQRIINKISGSLFKTIPYDYFHHDIDLVFPGDTMHRFHKRQAFLFWIPDFQEHYLPGFFSQKEINARKASQKYIVETGENIVFSSQVARDHFNEIYKGNKLNQFVLQFAVTHPDLRGEKNTLIKYNLSEKYFLCSNQFWQHKNHKVLLESVGQLKRSGYEIKIVFTGKEQDYRATNYFNELQVLVKELNIEKEILFLGFIDREDQLNLMKNSLAVIQPSLFEGWSTVIEDAKALNIQIIASDIPVHIEQLADYAKCLTFERNNEKSLGEKLLFVKNGLNENCTTNDYSKNVYAYGKNFISITESALQVKI